MRGCYFERCWGRERRHYRSG
uniref:Glutamyl-tRNA reductase n=1 Tax=Rhizophora mucronata TaxID=61149 RepID=A0A2P2IWT3_RHIMU